MGALAVLGTLGAGGLAGAVASIACYVKSRNMKKSGNIKKASKYEAISALLVGLSAATLELPIQTAIAMLFNFTYDLM